MWTCLKKASQTEYNVTAELLTGKPDPFLANIMQRNRDTMSIDRCVLGTNQAVSATTIQQGWILGSFWLSKLQNCSWTPENYQSQKNPPVPGNPQP